MAKVGLVFGLLLGTVLFSKEILHNKHNRIGDRPLLFEIPEIESQDIDVELNFKVAEFLFKEINGLNSK